MWFRTKLGCLLFLSRWKGEVSHISTFTNCRMSFSLKPTNKKGPTNERKEHCQVLLWCWWYSTSGRKCGKSLSLYFSKRPQNPLPLKSKNLGKKLRETALNICSRYFSNTRTHIYVFLKLYLHIHVKKAYYICVFIFSVLFGIYDVIWGVPFFPLSV